MAKRTPITLNPDAEVSDPKSAVIIQLEILAQKCDMAVRALKLSNRHVYSGLVNDIRQHVARIHRLSYQPGSADDKRLVEVFKKSHTSSDYQIQVFDDEGARAIGIEGLFDMDKLAKYMSW